MSKSLNEDHDEDIEVSTPHPGQRLHVARLNAKLELDKVAAQMHLSEEMLLAVEADEYDILPSRVFVRGYFRNYARLVGLPEAEILAELDQAWPEEVGADITIRPVGRHIKPEVHSSHRLVRLFTWLVVLGLLSLVVIWWVGYLKPKGVSSAEPVAEAVDTIASAPAGVSLPAAPPAPALPTEQPAAPSAAPVAETSLQDAPPANTTTAAVVSAPPVVDTPSVSPEQPVAPTPKVVLRFKDDSWVDIRDSTRKFRLFGIVKAGSVRELGGQPPYTVLLGNSAAVDITIDGKPFDQRRYNKGNVARFTLAVDNATAP